MVEGLKSNAKCPPPRKKIVVDKTKNMEEGRDRWGQMPDTMWKTLGCRGGGMEQGKLSVYAMLSHLTTKKLKFKIID